MNKNIFSPSLFKEGFKQLKIVGIIGTVVMLLFSTMAPLSIIFENRSYYAQTYRYITLKSYVEPGYLIFMLFIPLMMLMLFNFLSKRNACDFYHAIPVKRSVMYRSFILAVVAWTLIMTAIISVLPFAIFNLCGRPWKIIYTSYFYTILFILGGSLLVIGGASIGISITGTVFTNIVVSIMVLCAPRLLIYIINSQIRDIFDFIPETGLSFLVRIDNNAIFKALTSLFGSSSSNIGFSAGYSAVLGIIYIIIGKVIFKRRKSEIASMPSMNDTVQGILRMIPAFIITSIGTIAIVTGTLFNSMDNSDRFNIFLIYIVGIFIYFLYELITTKKWSRVGKSAKFLPILFAINILLGIAIFVPANNLINKIPEKDEIEYVKIDNLSKNKFNLAGIDDYKIDDPEILKIVADAYAKQMKKFKENGYFYYYDTTETTFVKMSIHTTNMGTLQRKVYLSDNQLIYITNQIMNNKKYPNIKYELRKCSDMESISLDSEDIIYYDDIENIYYSLINEINEDENPINKILYNEKDAIDCISYLTDDGYCNLNIGTATPKTTKLLIDSVNNANEAMTSEKLQKCYGEIDNHELDFDISIWINNEKYRNYYISGTDERLNNLLESLESQDIQSGNVIMKVCFSDYEMDTYTKYIHYYQIDSTQAKQIIEIFDMECEY